jgi:hypothetical protein
MLSSYERLGQTHTEAAFSHGYMITFVCPYFQSSKLLNRFRLNLVSGRFCQKLSGSFDFVSSLIRSHRYVALSSAIVPLRTGPKQTAMLLHQRRKSSFVHLHSRCVVRYADSAPQRSTALHCADCVETNRRL